MDQLDTTVRGTSPGGGQLEISADRGTITLLPGAQHHLNLICRNTSGSPLIVELEVVGPPSSWLALTQSALYLSPAQSTRVTLTLTAPRDAPSGSYPLAITALSRDDPTVRVQIDLVFEIAEPGQIAVELVPTQAEGQASAELQVRLAQNGAAPLHVNLSASGDQSACSFTFEPATLAVAPDETATSRLTVTARQPLVGVDTRTFPFDVLATTSEGATAMSQAHGQFVQRRLPALEFAVKPVRQSGGGPVSFAVQISNPSQVGMRFQLSATDSEGSSQFQFEPPILAVPAAGTAQATLTVAPLQYHSDALDKTHRLTIRAAPAEGLVSALQADVTFVQTAIERPTLTLRPSSQSAPGARAFVIQVTNPRATPMQVTLTPSSLDGMCELDVNPAQMKIPPHAKLAAQLNVRPISRLLQGESRRTCAFTVQARIADLPDPVQVQGSLIQVPGAPIGRWLGMAGAAVLALAVCGGLLWVSSSALRSLGSQLPEVSALIPTPLPLVTPVPVPTQTPTLIPVQAPTSVPADNQMPGGSSNQGGGGPPPKPTNTPNIAATQTAIVEQSQAAATKTAAAQLTANAEKTAQALRFSQYNGNWLNDDANTSGITRLEISNNNATISVHAFARCPTGECDWGTKNGTFKNEPFSLQFDLGGGQKHQLAFSKDNNQLKIVDAGPNNVKANYTFHISRFLPPIVVPPNLTLVLPIVTVAPPKATFALPASTLIPVKPGLNQP